MTWAGLKKGDECIVVDNLNEPREQLHYNEYAVTSVGPKWITVKNFHGGYAMKFDTETGRGEFGTSVHTEETLAAARTRHRIGRRLARLSWWMVPTEALVAINKILDDAGVPK